MGFIMTACYLLISLFFGAVGIILALIEIREVYSFIDANQGDEDIPKINKNNNRSISNKQIRDFRHFVFSKEAKSNLKLFEIRRKLLIYKIATMGSFLIMVIIFLRAYFLSSP